MNYTEEEKKDIEERVAKANEFLKELNLTPAAQVFKVRVSKELGMDDKDMFADQVIPYLQDTKYHD